MIGSQSTAYHVVLNGLKSRTPYDVGRSISTSSVDPTSATAMRRPSNAAVTVSRGPRHFRIVQTITADATASPTMPSGPWVGPRCAARYGTAPPVMAEMMSRSARSTR